MVSISILIWDTLFRDIKLLIFLQFFIKTIIFLIFVNNISILGPGSVIRNRYIGMGCKNTNHWHSFSQTGTFKKNQFIKVFLLQINMLKIEHTHLHDIHSSRLVPEWSGLDKQCNAYNKLLIINL